MSVSQDTFDYVAALVRREAAIVLEVGKEYLVEARLVPLARTAGVETVDAYVLALKRSNNREEIRKVVDALTTNETSWLRDSEPFQALVSEVVPSIMAKKRASKTLSIWSAACSSGQEPYGIAMMLDDLLRNSGWHLEILATDINSDMLRKAQKGVFSQLEMNRGLPAAMLVKHFTRLGASWKISDQLRQAVSFKQLNLAQPLPPLPTFDVIFLRNVLIYLDAPTKRSILQRVQQVLSPDGFLFLGGAETTLGIDDSWDRVKIGRSYAHCPKPSTTPSRPYVPTPRSAESTPAASAGTSSSSGYSRSQSDAAAGTTRSSVPAARQPSGAPRPASGANPLQEVGTTGTTQNTNSTTRSPARAPFGGKNA